MTNMKLSHVHPRAILLEDLLSGRLEKEVNILSLEAV